MVFNYHELMVGQKPDGAAQRKQYLAICTLGFGVFVASLINAGGLQPVRITEGTFPGGEYIYQARAKDYASSMGLVRRVGQDLEIINDEGRTDLVYSLFLDEESKVPAGKTRYMAGALLSPEDPDEGEGGMRDKLLTCHADERRLEIDGKKKYGDGVDSVIEPYQVGTLPRARAAVSHFPFTNGFISCLLHSYKVLPKMIRYSKKHADEGSHPVTLTTCSVEQQMCTHYAPLSDGDKFLLGRADTVTYAKELRGNKAKDEGISVNNVLKGLRKLLPF